MRRLLLCLLLCGAAFPAAAPGAGALAVILENDLLYNPAPGKHQDRHYTQGLKFIWLDAGAGTPAWADHLQLDWAADRLPGLGFGSGAVRRYGLTFGQSIYTPEDDRAVHLLEEDRPYAGWLYAGAFFQREETLSRRWSALESTELDIGLIGPEAQGEWAQNTVHQIRELPLFNGWNNQLKTEPAFVLKYGRAWRGSFGGAAANILDIIPHAGAALGTTEVSGQAGFTARLGWNLPAHFGVQRIDSAVVLSDGKHAPRFGFHGFAGAEGRLVGRNVFLDGNLWQRSHHVDANPAVGTAFWGVAATLGKHCEWGWTFCSRSREFDGQRDFDRFGSMFFKYHRGF